MGCASSKLDDLPAVELCRQRCAFLDEAIRHRYSLAEAHVSYIHCLKDVGLSLRRFFDQDLDSSTAGVGPPSPVLNLPPQRKGGPDPSGSPPSKSKAIHHHSDSNSGSHLDFLSDSDDSDSESLHHHSGKSSPLHSNGQISYVDQEALSSYPVGFMNSNFNISYTKSKAAPSVLYEQKPMIPQTAYVGESSSSYYPYPYANQNQSPDPYYSNSGDGSRINGFFSGYGYSSTPAAVGPAASAPSEASTSKPPPPPPSPPQSSAWDFLNPFESFERYYPPYTPTRDSREVREEEGIPDLEDEDFPQEVVKDLHEDKKFVDGGGHSGGKPYSKAVVDEKAGPSDSLYRTRGSATHNDPVEYGVHMVDKKAVDQEEIAGDRGNLAAFKVRLSGDSEIVREIQAQFERASESEHELRRMLEVGKFPYKKSAAYQAVSSKLLHVTTPSLAVLSSQPSASKSAEPSSIEKVDPANLDIDEGVGMGSGNLSSTLQKLYLWEKKLYEEVKVEEKMRVLHDRKSAKLKRLDERGAEAHKIEATRTLVRSLSTKIRIAIQVVDKISVKINKLRDEELWPQLNELIKGLTKLWKSLLECHRGQCQALGQARRLDTVASRKHLSDAHLEVTLQLEYELLNWILRFSCWVGAQKGYVRALNNWLTKCLIYVPEETDDGIVPFSPGRIGAPPIFVICNQWSQSMDRISEKEMRECAQSVLQLRERDVLEMRQRMIANKELESKVKSFEREDHKIQKEIQAWDKRLVLVSGDGHRLSVSGNVVYQSDTSKTSSLQTSLQLAFETMERFTANSLNAYKELLQRIDEDRQDRLARENNKAS